MSWDMELHVGVLEIQPTEVLSVNTARTAGRPAVPPRCINEPALNEHVSASRSGGLGHMRAGARYVVGFGIVRQRT
jgi:hypothetical protein